MRRQIGIAFAAFSAALIMALATTNASANRLSVNNHNFRVVWRSLAFQATGGGFGASRCSVTLEGSFHSNTIKKIEKALIGHVTRASIGNPCTNGSATVHTETLPWKIDYNGFSGILPRITRVRFLLVGASLRISQSIFGIVSTCETTSEEAQPGEGEAFIETGSNTTSYQPDPNTNIATTGASCPETEARFSSPEGDGQITLLGNTTRIKITLI